MRLENILALTRGALQNDPFIIAFDTISHNARRVKRGDLFIALDPDSISEAIINGAYGIIFDRPTQITDDEIAWIKVDSIDDAMLRLLRFQLIDKQLNVFLCDKVTLGLASQMLTSNDFIVLDDDFLATFKRLWDCDEGSTILYHDGFTDKALFTTSEPMPRYEEESVEIIEQTLFETAFIHKRIFYERQTISPFFLPYLQQLLDFMDHRKIRFRLRTFKSFGHFDPVFVSAALERREFGGSDKVLIFEPDLMLIDAQMQFLRENANWARCITLLPANSTGHLETMRDTFTYDDEADIMRSLKKHDFHFALIGGVDQEIMDRYQDNEQPQQLSFDL